VARWEWQQNDILIIDNHSSMHARTAYDASTQQRPENHFFRDPCETANSEMELQILVELMLLE
jgi:hypothetical protein